MVYGVCMNGTFTLTWVQLLVCKGSLRGGMREVSVQAIFLPQRLNIHSNIFDSLFKQKV